MKSVFLTTFEIFGDKDKKIISESKHATAISLKRESFEGKLKHF